MAKKTKVSTQRARVIESVGIGATTKAKPSESGKENSDQPIRTFFIKYGTAIGLSITSIGVLLFLFTRSFE